MKNNHLRLKMRQAGDEKSAVFFGGGDRDLPPTPWDIAFTIDRNNFRGNTSLQIVIQDIIASKSV
jgi:single-stranded-DNA-specific exonuclease